MKMNLEMGMASLNISAACSSLILYQMGQISLTGDFKTTFDPNFNTFCKNLVRLIEIKDQQWKDGFQNYKFEDYAFLTACTSHRQDKIEEYLRDFGFEESQQVGSNKNPKERVTFWIMPTYRVLEELEQMDLSLKYSKSSNTKEVKYQAEVNNA